MLGAGSMAMYSSSPPATWCSSPNATSTSTTKTVATATDVDLHTRHPHSSKSVQGGLSSLFSNNANSRPVATAVHHSSSSSSSSWSHSDALEYSGHSCSTSGTMRTDVAGHQSVLRETGETRAGAVSIPVSSSLRSGERVSPVSVLQSPTVSRHGSSPAHSLGGGGASRDSVGNSGLPPLDPHHHMERVSRRKSSLPFARSVGFEVRSGGGGGGGGFPSHEHQSRIRGGSLIAAASSDTADHSTTFSSSSDLLLHVQGFAPSISSSLGDSPLDTLALPVNPFPAGGGGANNTSNFQRETPAVLEAREKLLRLVEESNGLASLAPPSPPHVLEEVDTPVPSSAIKLLESAQAQHKVFCDPTVVKAFRLADDAHKGQFRRNGDLYLTHCVETALILAATGAAVTVVAAGLLHDAIDDSNLSQQLLRGAMGDEIADIVLGVSRLSEFSQLARDNQTVRDPMEADRLRNMILSMVDVRVVLIKLADRLHNMRTLGALSFRKQLQIANETLEIFAPLANRLGIWSWKAELEDLCFKHLKPEEYKELATRLSGCCREGIVMSSIHQLYEALQSQGVQFTDLSGRPKNLYSIYKKMMRKGRTVEEIFDVRGLRLIVVDEKSCYDALRIVHELWLHIPGQSKDYIVMPKPNGYQSLHTVVWGDDGYPLEVQIRTVAMHHQAEFGLAAHWRYKEDDSIHSSFILARVEWARWVLTWHSEILDTKLRLSPLRADLKPPCPFPVHTSDCPYASMCCGPQLSGTEPLLIIKVENENMVVQELPPGSTVADLMSTRKSDIESLAVSSRRPSRKEARVKVNHQFVDTFQQKLRMGDLVEVTMVVVTTFTSQPSTVHTTSGEEQPCGKIALEFQREQLKRLYLDGGDCSGETRRSTPLERSPSVAGLT